MLPGSFSKAPCGVTRMFGGRGERGHGSKARLAHYAHACGRSGWRPHQVFEAMKDGAGVADYSRERECLRCSRFRIIARHSGWAFLSVIALWSGAFFAGKR